MAKSDAGGHEMPAVRLWSLEFLWNGKLEWRIFSTEKDAISVKAWLEQNKGVKDVKIWEL